MSALLRRVRGRFAARGDTEHGQALVRIGVLGVVLAYLLSGPSGIGRDAYAHAVSMVLAGLLSGALILGWLFVAPARSDVRRAAGMVADYGLMAAVMIRAGEPLAWVYVLVMWVTIGNGLRFGRRYLAAAIAAALVSFGLVLALSPYWRANLPLGLGLLAALAAIPLYLMGLAEELSRTSIETHRESEAKSRFLSGIAQEFGAPLERLAGSVEDLCKTSLGAAQRERLDAIRGTTRALQALVNEVGDIATPAADSTGASRAKARDGGSVPGSLGGQGGCDSRGASSGNARDPAPLIGTGATAPQSGVLGANVIAFGNPFLRHRSRVRSLHVLIADRDTAHRATIQRLLEKAGHRAACVDEDDDIAATLARTPFDLVIADVTTAAAFNRECDAAGARTPLLVFADVPESEAFSPGEAAAVWCVLAKPASTIRLLDALAEIGRGGRQGSAPRSNVPGRVDDIEFDPAVLDELASIGMGEAFEREFIAECLADASRSLGLLAESASRSDWMQVREHANAIGGVAGNVGLTKLSRLAGEVVRAPDWQLAGEWRDHIATLRDRLEDGRRALDARLDRYGVGDPASRSD